jgi:hypothetical protein
MESGVQSEYVLPVHSVVDGSPSVSTPPTAEPSIPTSETKLDRRLAAVLRGLTKGLACDGAEFYTLNSASTELTLRADFRVDERKPGASRRPLSAARADVAAMAGNAIVLEDDLEIADWSVPVWCGAAICLPVASDQTIHGTMWIYNNDSRAFADAEVELAEVVAGRLAAELELESWQKNSDARAASPSASRAIPGATARSGQRLLQPAAPALEDWEIAGWTTDRTADNSYYDWQTFPDGRTLTVAGFMVGSSRDAAALHSVRIALRAHASESQDAGELLTRVNHTLWMASPGGEGLTLAVALLDSDGAHASVAMAGAAAVLRWRASTCELLPASSAPAGWSEQTVYVARGLDLFVRERLVLITSPESMSGRLSQARLARDLSQPSADELRAMPGKRALRLVADVVATSGAPPSSLALVRRR